MRLKELEKVLLISRFAGDSETQFSGLAMDSRKVRPGDLFICVRGGMLEDRHQYAADAVERGASAFILERDVEADAPKIFVPDARRAMALVANHFYDYPSGELKLIGVTGTNGKTTTTMLIERILADHGWKTGAMGTIQMKIGDRRMKTSNTTQESLDLQRNLRAMTDIGTAYCVMEVSSHALELGRVIGCDFKTAVFTNLTQDHLDFHVTMEAYRRAKGLLFARLGNGFARDEASRKYAVLNADDAATEDYRALTAAEVVTYGIEREADVRAEHIRVTAGGTQFHVRTFRGDVQVNLRLLGKFNVYNCLGAIAATLLEGVSLEQIKNSLEKVNFVDGRMESIHEGQSFLAIVDYAHTPDGLENALLTIREFAERKVICVFGCGGDRDRGKRPIMGGIAAKYSDYVIVTSDNPRSERQQAIAKEIEAGIVNAGLGSERYELIDDRRAGIRRALSMAAAGDVVLIAGKGHELGQIIDGVVYPFDERQEVKIAIKELIG